MASPPQLRRGVFRLTFRRSLMSPDIAMTPVETPMSTSLKMDRRAFLKGMGGIALALPVLDAMGAEVTGQVPRRFCALYTANGMSLPKAEHGLAEWSWFPSVEH